ncbi:MAG: hypothetical protein M3N51_04340, partial [Actinomycetota bacterium]|nr:hypothetical protein [Actinomycetota bacterium]
MRSVTTLVAVVGERATHAATQAAQAAGNVSMEPVGDVPPQPTEAIERMREVWRRAQRHGSIYTLVDADPLGPVVRQWAARLEGQAHDLEVAIGLSADLPMPDFYLVAT